MAVKKFGVGDGCKSTITPKDLTPMGGEDIVEVELDGKFKNNG